MVRLEGTVTISVISKTDMIFYRVIEGSLLGSCIIALLKFIFEPSLAVRAAACSQVPKLFLLQLPYMTIIMLSCLDSKPCCCTAINLNQVAVPA